MLEIYELLDKIRRGLRNVPKIVIEIEEMHLNVRAIWDDRFVAQKQYDVVMIKYFDFNIVEDFIQDASYLYESRKFAKSQ
jgi:hypothetical protein